MYVQVTSVFRLAFHISNSCSVFYPSPYGVLHVQVANVPHFSSMVSLVYIVASCI